METAALYTERSEQIALLNRESLTMLAFYVRGERFTTGLWEHVLKNGRVTTLLNREEELRETVPEE